jgi:hypothetical protein
MVNLHGTVILLLWTAATLSDQSSHQVGALQILKTVVLGARLAPTHLTHTSHFVSSHLTSSVTLWSVMMGFYAISVTG